MKRLAIIGGQGMLGVDLTTYLSSEYTIVSITKDNYASFVGETFDVIVNANGNSKRFWANQHPLEDFSLSTQSVYTSFFDFSCDMYIYISSSDVYNDHGNPQHAREDNVIDPTKLSSYGLHKYISELLVKKYASKWIILRSSMILGTQLKKGPIFDLLHRKELFISENSHLQMLHTREIANIIIVLLKKEIKNQTFNMGGKGSISFKEISTFFPHPPTFSSSTEAQEYEMNVEKLSSILPLQTSETYLQDFLATLS